MAVAAALRVAQGLGEDDVVVVLLPDHGRGYLSRLYDDAWLDARGIRLDTVAVTDPIAEGARS